MTSRAVARNVTLLVTAMNFFNTPEEIDVALLGALESDGKADIVANPGGTAQKRLFSRWTCDKNRVETRPLSFWHATVGIEPASSSPLWI